MNHQKNSIILEVIYRLITPFLLMFGIYVLIHGEFSPGGGFQAGVLLGLSVICERLLSPSQDTRRRALWQYRAVAVAGFGTLFYALVGTVCVLLGGNFLEYGLLPVPVEETAKRHIYGMLLIETGVTVCVAATVVSIFDSLGKWGGEGP